jgi:hypothetical protein
LQCIVGRLKKRFWCIFNFLLSPCVRRFFPKFSFLRVSEIDLFSNFGNILVMSDSRKLVLTLIFPKNLRKFSKIRVGTSRNGNVRAFRTRPDSRKLVSTCENSSRLENRRLKVRNAGPYFLLEHELQHFGSHAEIAPQSKCCGKSSSSLHYDFSNHNLYR